MANNSRKKQSAKPSEDYYSILGVTRTATDEEIKRAYRKLALQLHPDKNPDPQATARFQEIAKAYKILGNPQTRSTYDRFGSQAAEMVNQYDDYPETFSRLSRCQKVLFGLICCSTGCCFGCGCCCLCCCGCCCGFCCNNCCGKYRPSPVSPESETESTGYTHQQPTNSYNDSNRY